MRKIGIFFLFVSLLAVGCKDDDTAPIAELVGEEYLPLSSGQESIYQIDSIKYNEFTGRVDTIRLQLRELVKDAILDAEQRRAFEVEIYQRANDTLDWRLIRVVRKTKLESRYELLDNNQKMVPLIFPAQKEKAWDVNSLNATAALEYVYTSVNEEYFLNGIRYDSTLTVAQIDEENLIERTFASEKYAMGFGMIYRKHIDIRTDFDNNILSGYEATVELIRFSK